MKSLSPYHHVLRRTDRSLRTKEQSTRNLSPEGLSGALPYPTQLTALCLFVMQKNQPAAGETGQYGFRWDFVFSPMVPEADQMHLP